jgi:porphobilinogen deaminase
MAERYMLERIDGNCQTPIGSISNIKWGGMLTMEAQNWETGKRGFVRGPRENYKELGYELGSMLI